MAFTTQIFLFVFFPICIAVYYLVSFAQSKGLLSAFLQKIRATDLALIGIGCVFYMWTCFDDLFRFLIYIFVIYLLGLMIGRIKKSGLGIALTAESESKKIVSAALPLLAVSVLLVTGILVHFKYTGMVAQVWNFLFKDNLSGKSLTAPLGISFITFSAVSYLADIYMGKAEAGNLIDCALYLTFFPKVVSGPIVLWRDFREQIGFRKIHLEGISNGVLRIMIGFAKKLILADTFGACVASASGAIDIPTALGAGLLYMLQIYYDFSGYSDVAIGLSQMLGFTVKENFDFPYLSCSITEFWRRWHISLGTWFREYVYFPLGGSRAGKGRTLLNIGVVFLLTGIWHGAGWAYMLWGIINGLCNMAEKLLKDNKLYSKTPRFLKWAMTMTVTYFSWGLFRFGSISSSINWLLTALGLRQYDAIPYRWQYYFDNRIIVFAVIGILGSTVWGLPAVQSKYQKLLSTKAGYLVHGLLAAVLFVIAIMFMINSKYSPFIYFQY